MTKIKFSNSKIPNVDRNTWGHNLWAIAAAMCWLLALAGVILFLLGIQAWAMITLPIFPAIMWTYQAYQTHKEGK